MSERPPSLAAIVTCRDRGRALAGSLAGLRGDATREVIVVDEGSEDPFTRRALEELSTQGVTLVRLEGTGGRQGRGASAASWSAGLRASSAPLVLLLPAERSLEAGALSRLVELFTDPGVVAASCVPWDIAVDGASPEARMEPRELDVAEIVGGLLPPSPLLLRRSAVEAAGGLDEGAEERSDLELLLRLRLSGGKLLLCPGSVAGGPGRASSPSSWARRSHAVAVEHWRDVILARERAILQARARQRELLEVRGLMERELAATRERVAAARAELARRGIPAVDWGDLGRPRPFSPEWGVDRGKPIDRVYIEAFLGRHAADVRGRVLEVKDPGYTRAFGGEAVTASHVLDVDPRNPKADLVADLATADMLSDDAFDCVILTQTLSLVRDPRAAVGHLFRVLRPGGVLLLTAGALDRVDHEDGGLEGPDSWRFTEFSLRALLAAWFPPELVEVEAHGNLRAATGFLYGLAAEEMPAGVLADRDPYLPLCFTARARKASVAGTRPGRRLRARGEAPEGAGLVLCYHRIGAGDGAVSEGELRDQLSFLRDTYGVLALPELVAAASKGRIAAGAVALSFDDATSDHLSRASRILGELGLPAAFFAAPGLLGEAPWWRLLERALTAEELSAAGRVELPGIAGMESGLDVSTPGARRRTLEALRRRMVHAGAAERERILAAVATWHGDAAPPSDERCLTRDELRALAGSPGVTIGAHGMRHLLLGVLPPREQEEEMAQSVAELRAITGQDVTLFAYPYGADSREAAAAARRLGLLAAFTTRPSAFRDGVDAYRIPRMEIAGDDVRAFDERIARALREAHLEGERA